MASRIVTDIADVLVENIVPPILKQNSFEQKSKNGAVKKISYFTLPLEYKHSNGHGGHVKASFTIQCDEISCKNGIMQGKFESEDGRPSRSTVLVEFGGENAEKYNSISDTIQQISAEAVFANLGKLGAFGKKFMDNDDDVIDEKAVVNSIKKAITPAMNFRTTEDGKRDATRPRYRYVQLNDYGPTRTIFYRPGADGRLVEVPSKLLYNRSIRILPTLDFKRVYIGATASVQVFLASAILISVTAAPTITPAELAAAKRILDANPDAASELEKSLKEMESEVQESTKVHQDEPIPEFAKADSPTAADTHEDVQDNDNKDDLVDADSAAKKTVQTVRRFKRN